MHECPAKLHGLHEYWRRGVLFIFKKKLLWGGVLQSYVMFCKVEKNTFYEKYKYLALNCRHWLQMLFFTRLHRRFQSLLFGKNQRKCNINNRSVEVLDRLIFCCLILRYMILSSNSSLGLRTHFLLDTVFHHSNLHRLNCGFLSSEFADFFMVNN